MRGRRKKAGQRSRARPDQQGQQSAAQDGVAGRWAGKKEDGIASSSVVTKEHKTRRRTAVV